MDSLLALLVSSHIGGKTKPRVAAATHPCARALLAACPHVSHGPGSWLGAAGRRGGAARRARYPLTAAPCAKPLPYASCTTAFLPLAQLLLYTKTHCSAALLRHQARRLVWQSGAAPPAQRGTATASRRAAPTLIAPSRSKTSPLRASTCRSASDA